MESIRTNSPIEFTSLPGQIQENENFDWYKRDSIVSTQPRSSRKDSDKWMEKPEGAENCPENLEYLEPLKGLLIQQELPLSTVQNRYVIKNMFGERIYYINEYYYDNMRTDYGHGYGPGYVLKVMDKTNNEVMRFNRLLKTYACCWCASMTHCESCSHLIIVEASSQKIGYVGQSSSCWKPYLTILDDSKTKMFRIHGPCCFTSKSNSFEIFASNYGSYIGKIFLKQTGESIKFPDHYQVTFPLNLNARQKAMFLAALLLIDSIYFESKIVETEKK